MHDLAPESTYFPWTDGRYSVAPRLKPLGTSFGNGTADHHVIQIDRSFLDYRTNKVACMRENRDKYWKTENLSADVSEETFDAVSRILSRDYPGQFSLTSQGLTCDITGETIVKLPCGNLDRERSNLQHPATTLVEALAWLLPCDLALVTRDDLLRDRISAIHLCAPSHWAAEDKFGKSFFETHLPIPGFDSVNSVAAKLVESLIHRGPFVRFVWGIESNDRLNHHPIPPSGEDETAWHGRQFGKGRFYVRTERQTTLGLPKVNAVLFFIQVQHIADSVILQDSQLTKSLVQALESMSPEAREYKGIGAEFEMLMNLLRR